MSDDAKIKKCVSGSVRNLIALLGITVWGCRN